MVEQRFRSVILKSNYSDARNPAFGLAVPFDLR
jgi:hypothetical protein